MEEVLKLACQLSMQGVEYEIIVGIKQINIEIK